ncbi:MAG: ferritin-like domain-containing protein [Epsilonproteobacteria bacterium]|nr:ferritin-like domain-containing protein [Campylobacterota bacterium]
MEFYQELENILEASTPEEKISRFYDFYELYKKDLLKTNNTTRPKEFKNPSYATFCTIVSPRDVPKRTNLTTKEGQINLLHAIAHIEYTAIDLALDICYRFRNMPKEFYDDWLEVAEDEIRHFKMIDELLVQIGGKYGSIPVHNSIFEASQRTAHSLLDRLAVVPRYLEANGLDATPQILKKLKTLPKNSILDNIKSILEVILEEEVDHVKKGDRWFEFTCKQKTLSKDVYIKIINQYYPQGFAKLKTLNEQARLQAGFTKEELNQINMFKEKRV